MKNTVGSLDWAGQLQQQHPRLFDGDLSKLTFGERKELFIALRGFPSANETDNKS